MHIDLFFKSCPKVEYNLFKVTLLVHGEEGLEKARLATEALYGHSIAAIAGLNAEEIADVFKGAEIVEILPQAGQTLIDLSLKAGCFQTESTFEMMKFVFFC